MSGVTSGGDMCYPVCGMVYIKDFLLLIGKSSLAQVGAAASFLSHRHSGPLPYDRK